MIKTKEYPPVISINIIVEDRLLGAKSHTTVKKRLLSLGVRILQYDMVITDDFFNALMPKEETLAIPVITRGAKPFKLK